MAAVIVLVAGSLITIGGSLAFIYLCNSTRLSLATRDGGSTESLLGDNRDSEEAADASPEGKEKEEGEGKGAEAAKDDVEAAAGTEATVVSSGALEQQFEPPQRQSLLQRLWGKLPENRFRSRPALSDDSKGEYQFLVPKPPTPPS
ncbi:hypothetical protein CYMTET_15651 [Cymbomonas tetramitiformis]|uniref:Uncharacterized protein n=1 Tax=Cymbomonas tetramitiformis TaxID=36881 RepID=A0AAE0GE55_9CHLO|nr:hypothetical protein CYMTET_15651 [Cymbomonas tetramitiformis]|eukprot:gene13466-15913_t